MPAELEQLVRDTVKNRCETQTLEVKAAAEGTPRVYDSLSSFSNQNEGGIILFGIDEQAGFTICGVYNAQDLQKKVYGQCEGMTPHIRPVFATVTVDGKTVVAAYINGRPMSERPVYRTSRGITEGSYTRIGDADVRMTATELYEIESFKEGRRDDISISPSAEPDMLDKTKVAQFIIDAAKERPLLARRSDDEILTLTGVMQHGKPTLAGMLTLGDYPQRIYPNSCITAIAVNGTDIQPDGNGQRFTDNKRYEGTISEMLEGATGFVARNSRTKVVIRNGKRTDIPEYPETAVREILTNALMHRDYGPYSNGTPIRLVLFSDRLECWNPGGVYGGQSINDLGYANMPTRNPTLVSLLEIEKIAENRHSGIPVIREEAADCGVRQPEFIDSKGSFMVRFFNTADPAERTEHATPTEPANHIEHIDNASDESHAQVSTEQAQSNTHERYTDSEQVRQRILRYCATPRSAQDIAGHLGLSMTYVRRAYVLPLVAGGQLALTLPDKPRSKFQRYQSSTAV
ncbi:ATP-binding protein [Bifidobacterium reuteri]|nr:ATP-binding protein [Bifidobacterium reuteri]